VPLVASLGLMSCLKGGTISSIEVTPANANLASGEMQQFIATAKFSDGTSLNWTSAVNWNSSNTAVAIVSNVTGSNGIVTAVAVSTATAIITATDLTNNLSGNATLAVNNPVTITVTPADQVISLATTTQLQFKAAAIFTPGTALDLTTLVFWSSSNTGVATISNASGTNGLANLVGIGTTSITATDLITNITGTTTLTVTP
jgi:hypothetical protein